MENYEVISKLGKGAQGSVFLVKRLDNDRKFVLKKIECNDEGEANKAFQEALALQQLQHPYICGYREFFVTWDHEVAAMFVCIVTEYCKNGDLDRVLKQRRLSKQPIEELILKKWLGQIVEALVFVHNKQIVHRDLKPSNVFMKDDLSISLGDFGVATVMGDARTTTRTIVGSMNWIAPEVLERPCDERSDVWSAGCIALEMATCGFYDQAQISARLVEIKTNPPALEETLEEIQKTYTSDLVSVIRTMLRFNFKERPSAVDLLQIPYITDCLVLSASALVDSKRKDFVDVEKYPVPKEGSYTPVLEYIKENQLSENCVTEALKYLEELSQSPNRNSLEDSGKRLIVQVMTNHLKCVMIQTLSCRIIHNLIVGAAASDFLYSKSVISAVHSAMRAHSGTPELQKAAVELFIALSSDEVAALTIGQCGGIQDVLEVMRAYPNNTELLSNCCHAIWSLTVNETNAKIVTEEKGLRDVVNAISAHPGNAELVEGAAAALLSLSMEDDNLEQVSDLNCVGHLVDAIKCHLKQAKVVKNACMALTCLVEPDEESAYRVLNNPVEDGTTVAGIPIIVEAYNQHKDNADVVENVCTLFMELCEYKDILSEMQALKCDKVLADVMRRFKENQDIMTPCNAALEKFNKEN